MKDLATEKQLTASTAEFRRSWNYISIWFNRAEWLIFVAVLLKR